MTNLIIDSTIIIIAALLGACWGSFLNVVSQRSQNQAKKERSILGRSFCDSCKHTLSALDLIPIISFIALKGKCRYCRKKIPARNLFGEITIAILFSFFALFVLTQSYALKADYLLIILLGAMFLVFTYLVSFDIWWLEIPLIPTIIVLVLAIIYRGALMINEGNYSIIFLLYVFAPVLVMAFINLLYNKQAFGMGDYLIITSLGLTLSAKGIFVALEATIVIAAIVGILYALKIGKFKGVQVPLVPFLVLGWLISLDFTPEIIKIILP